MTNPRDDLLDDALGNAGGATSFRIDRGLAAQFPGKAIFATEESEFDPWEFGQHGGCEIAPGKDAHAEIDHAWHRAANAVTSDPGSGWLDVKWQGNDLRVVRARWAEQHYRPLKRQWIVADSMKIAEDFFLAVTAWCHAPKREILTFNGGCWGKSRELFDTIEKASFDDLVLAGPLKDEIRSDFARFLASRAEYARYRVPWKRGVLFVGPPGNGKTHCLRATIKFLGVPCLYVQSFQAKYETDDANILKVFRHARSLTPCCLVFEDLDAMITSDNRSFFLNQLDGFAENDGILTLATTNHPERLDPAIVDRPSRFDRKYHFELPALAERQGYVRLWNARFEDAMRLSEEEAARIAGATDGFSFAYIKELFVSSMVRWMAAREPGAMPRVLAEQLEILKQQMQSTVASAPPPEEDANPMKAVEQMMKRMLF